MTDPPATTVTRPSTTRPGRWAPAVIALVAGLAYGVLSLRRYARVEFSSWDLAIFEQAVRGYADLSAPIVDVKGPGFHILGDHFSPIDALLAPAYRLFPAAQTLLVAQVVLIAISVLIVTRLAVRHLGTPAGIVLGLCYAVSFGLAEAVVVDFHEVAFAAPLLAGAGAAWVDRRPTAVIVWSLPLLLVKEDLGLTVMVIGLLLAWGGERRRGAVLAATGLFTTAVVVAVVLPAFGDGSYAYAGSLGGDAGVTTTAFTDTDVKAWTLVVTFAVGGFAALGSPWALVALPTLAWRFVGDVPTYWGTEWHYSLVLMPVVVCATVDTLAHRRRGRRATPVVVGIASAVAVLGLTSSPLEELVDPDLYASSPRQVALAQVLPSLPDGASVETDIALLAHVVSDHRAYWTGSIADAVPDYVLFDTTAGIGSPDPVGHATQRYGGSWRVVAASGGIVLAGRDDLT